MIADIRGKTKDEPLISCLRFFTYFLTSPFPKATG